MLFSPCSTGNKGVPSLYTEEESFSSLNQQKTEVFININIFINKTNPKIGEYSWEEIAMTARDIKIVNIVVSASLGQDIPLEKMAATLSNTEYNPEQFPGLVIRIKEPKTSALIFSSGKIVCTGARSMDKVKESIEKIIKSLEKINIKIAKFPDVKIQNMVAAGTVGMDLNLNTLAMKLDNTEYEPEQFPGLVYKLAEAKATFLLFSNGKVVCTGTKSEKEVHEALDKLIDNLKHIK